MKLSTKISNVASLESISLVALVIIFVRDLGSLHDDTAEYFNQLDTFYQLTNSIHDCDAAGSVDRLDRLDQKTNPAARVQPPKCPIDLDRLRYFDDLALDRWLSYRHIKPGGHFEPVGCVPRQKVAIIIPYRDKQEHLEKFLLYIHQFLPDQLIDYTIFVVEQADEEAFDRMKLFNVGAMKVIENHPDVCCFIFHEVDLLPLDQRNLYMCSRMPRHLSGSVSSYRYRLLYPRLFGGVVSISRVQYDLIGGFPEGTPDWFKSNEATIKRVVASGLSLERTPLEYGIYITAHNQWGKQNLTQIQESELTTFDWKSVEPVSRSNAQRNWIISLEVKQLYTHIKCSF
jgi:hypothetical protein